MKPPAKARKRAGGSQAARPNRRTTIIHVAERAGVALSTVSRVLNGGYASEEMRARVAKAARSLGYVPSVAARNLKKGRKGCIGVAVETSQGSWFTQILGGIELTVEHKSISVMLGSLALRGEYDASAVLGWISEQRVDGVIFVRCTAAEKEIVDTARKNRLPMVFVAPDEHFAAGPIVGAKNRDAAYELTTYLLSLGHTRFQFVGGPKASLDTQDRLRGVQEALAIRGVELEASQVAFAASYRIEDSAPFAEQWLRTPRGRAPTAVILGNDALATGFMRRLLQHGVSIPGEVSVAGFDDAPESAIYWPGLTTAAQPMRDMGSAACRALLAMIDDRESWNTARVDLPMSLVIRESTGPAPRRPARAPGA